MEDTEVHFGAKVKETRELRGWTQQRLRRSLLEASKIDLSPTAMTRLEGGKRPIRLNEAVALCKVLGLLLDGYVGPPALMSQKEVDEARKELKQIRGAESALVERLAQLRKSLGEEVAEAEESLRSWQEQRFRLEASIQAYAFREGDKPAGPDGD